MGKSVFLMTDAQGAAAAAQACRLKEKLERSSLSLSGPLSDKGGAVERFVGDVRVMAEFIGTDELSMAVRNLMPRNKPSINALQATIPMLEVPFILAEAPECGWGDYPVSAGEAASAPTVGFNGGLARPLCIAELTTLAVSVLRRLGFACHFSISSCCASEPGENPVSGTESRIVPTIVMPTDDDFLLLSVIHDQEGFFSMYPPVFSEALDDDALMAFLELNDAWYHAKTLMADMSKRAIKFDGEPELRSAQIGHLLSEGASHWSLSEAEADAADARGLIGSDAIKSYREANGQEVVRTLTDPKRHERMAAWAMLCDDLKRALSETPDADEPGVASLHRKLAVSSHTCCVPQFRDYLNQCIPIVNKHLHPASDCRADGRPSETGNSANRLD